MALRFPVAGEVWRRKIDDVVALVRLVDHGAVCYDRRSRLGVTLSSCPIRAFVDIYDPPP